MCVCAKGGAQSMRPVSVGLSQQCVTPTVGLCGCRVTVQSGIDARSAARRSCRHRGVELL